MYDGGGWCSTPLADMIFNIFIIKVNISEKWRRRFTKNVDEGDNYFHRNALLLFLCSWSVS